MTRTRALAVLAVGSAVALTAACAAPTGETTGPDRAGLRVLAASSLHGPLDELTRVWAEEHPGRAVPVIVYDGSATLLTQLDGGAEADVVALADGASTAAAQDGGLIAGEPVPLATNRLAIAVPPGNPTGVGGLADLAARGRSVVVCAPQVPCGAAARSVLDAAGVDLEPASEEQSVSAVLAKVAAGEADAGLVYVTDVLGADGAVDGVPFAEAASVVTRASVAVVAGAADPDGARDLIDLLVHERGRAVFARYGFGSP